MVFYLGLEIVDYFFPLYIRSFIEPAFLLLLALVGASFVTVVEQE